MRKPANLGASAVLALAFFLWTPVIPTPNWLRLTIASSAGVISAAFAIRLYLVLSPSLERFRRVCIFSGLSALFFASVALGLLSRFQPSVDEWVAVLILFSLATGISACLIWFYLTAQSYGRKPNHPDFAEDDEGNPIRLEPPN